MDTEIAELHNSQDFESVIDWFSENGPLYLEITKRRGYSYETYPDPDLFKVEITYLILRHSSVVSNSHSCPKDGVRNFGGNPSIPRGYPGWSGRIEFRYSHHVPGWSSDAMKELCIHTGTGGGVGQSRYGYDVQFFDADWPNLIRPYTFDLIKNLDMELNYTFGTPYYFAR